jgi:hypothetical protein
MAHKLTNRYIDEVEKMADWLVKQLTTLGATAEKRDIGTHELAGKECKLPSVVIGQLGNDPKKVCPNLVWSVDWPDRKPY